MAMDFGEDLRNKAHIDAQATIWLSRRAGLGKASIGACSTLFDTSLAVGGGAISLARRARFAWHRRATSRGALDLHLRLLRGGNGGRPQATASCQWLSFPESFRPGAGGEKDGRPEHGRDELESLLEQAAGVLVLPDDHIDGCGPRISRARGVGSIGLAIVWSPKPLVFGPKLGDCLPSAHFSMTAPCRGCPQCLVDDENGYRWHHHVLLIRGPNQRWIWARPGGGVESANIGSHRVFPLPGGQSILERGQHLRRAPATFVNNSALVGSRVLEETYVSDPFGANLTVKRKRVGWCAPASCGRCVCVCMKSDRGEPSSTSEGIAPQGADGTPA